MPSVRISTLLITFWLLAVCSSLGLNLDRERQERQRLALHSAKAFYDQILLTRAWNASHGGVYVPVTEATRPNPYLDTPKRDQNTDQGLKLTLVNPAYMVRQIAELGATRSGPTIHITSLRPIRPENQPSEWERRYLNDFEHGAAERFDFVDTASGAILRFMAPLRTEEGCLPCHARQGHREGDIRGGLSIVLPLPSVTPDWHLWLSHLAAGLIGLTGIAISGRLLENRNRALMSTNDQLRGEIIQRKNSEERLKRFEHIVAASQDHMAFIGTDFVYRAVNSTYLSAHRKEIDDILDHSVAELLGQETFELTVRGRLLRCLAGEQVVYREWFEFPGLNRRYMEVNYYPYLGADGTVEGVVVNSRDITENKLQEDELRRAKEEWEQTFDAISDFVSVHDPQHNFLKVNKSLAAFAGCSKDELHGRHCYEIVHGTDAPVANCPHLEALITKKTVTAEVFDPKLGELMITVSPILDANGEAKATVHIARSVAPLRAAEKERLALKEQLLQAQKMESIGRLAGGVAHDFNNLLSVIIGFSELAVRSLPPERPEIQQILQIKEAGQRAAGLTQQLLAFSRKQTLTLQPLNLDTTVTNVAKMLGRLIGEDIALVIQTGGAGTMLMADPVQIEQILMNLAVNARDAMPTGGTLTISTAVAELSRADLPVDPSLTPGRFALLDVTDTGLGMSQEVAANIFEPFFTTKELGKGTGLGLSTVYGIALQHGGFIKVASQPDKGSSFQIFLPVLPEVQRQPASPPSDSRVPGGRETILLVEDDPHTLTLLITVLESCGYKVLPAAHSAEALTVEATYQEAIDLLLTDVILPGQSGPQLAVAIQHRRPGIRIAFMSGYTDDIIARTGGFSSGIKLFQKPIGISALAAGLRDVFDSPPPAAG